MTTGLRSARVRLVVTFLALFAVVQSVLTLALLQHRRQTIRDELDNRLIEQARSLAGVVETAADGSATWWDAPIIEPFARAFGAADLYYEILLGDGSVLQRSKNLGEHALGAKSAESADWPPIQDEPIVLGTLEGDKATGVAGGDDIRFVSYQHDMPEGPPLLVRVGANASVLAKRQRSVVRSFWTAGLASLMAAGLTTWILAGRLLAPMKRLQEQMERLAAGDSDVQISATDLDDEFAHMVKALNAALLQLDQGLQEQIRLGNHIAHELKSPLAGMIGEIEAARRREDFDPRILKDIEEQLRRFASVVDNLHMLARTQAKEQNLSRATVSLNDVTVEALEQCQRMARLRAIRLVPNLYLAEEDQLEPIVLGEEGMLTILVENLVRNALRISARKTVVRVEVRVQDNWGFVCVRDEGPGLDEDAMDQIFAPFVSRSVQGGAPGLAGLGLTIALNIARLHGGHIVAGNREPRGAEFRIMLPLATPPAADSTDQ